MRTVGWQTYVKKPELAQGCAVVVKATGQRGIVCKVGMVLAVVILEGFETVTFRCDELALLGANKWGK